MHAAFRSVPFLMLLAVMSQTASGDEDAAPEPEPVDPRLKITLFAEQPTIVTPTGIDVDITGRVWALESNTHFPPDGYRRHPTDRLYVMRDTTGDGSANEFRDLLAYLESLR